MALPVRQIRWYDSPPMAKKQNAPKSAVAYFDEQLDTLRERVPAALGQFDEKAVHESRVATRRLKAGLDLLCDLGDAKGMRQLNRAGRRLRRRLGPLRDLDVMIKYLAGAKVPQRLVPALAWLQSGMVEQRELARHDDLRKGKKIEKLLKPLGVWAELRLEIEATSGALAPLLADALHARLDQFAGRAMDLAALRGGGSTGAAGGVRAGAIVARGGANVARGGANVARGGSRGAGGDQPSVAPPSGSIDVHAVRIEGKALRYTLELAAAHGMRIPQSIFRAFKKMQDALGDWHDQVVLAERTMNQWVTAELSHHNPELALDVLDLARHFQQSSARHLRTFSTLWQRSGDTLIATLRERVPLTRSVIELSPAAPQTTGGGDDASLDPMGTSKSASSSTQDASQDDETADDADQSDDAADDLTPLPTGEQSK